MAAAALPPIMPRLLSHERSFTDPPPLIVPAAADLGLSASGLQLRRRRSCVCVHPRAVGWLVLRRRRHVRRSRPLGAVWRRRVRMRMLRGSTRAAQVAVARRTEREIRVVCRRLVANMADMSEVINLYLQKYWLVLPHNGFRMKVCEAFLAEALPARPLRVMWLPADRWLVLHWARQAAQTLEDCMEGPTSSEHMFLRMKLGREEVRRDARRLRKLLRCRDFDLRMVWEQPDAVRGDVWLQRAEAWSRKRASGAGHHTVLSRDGAACWTEGEIWRCFLVARGSSDTMHGARCMLAFIGLSRGSSFLNCPAVMGGSALQLVPRGSCRAPSSARVC